MIYIDTSVALARIFEEDRSPSESLWEEQLLSSRLLEYEVWTQIHASGRSKSHSEAARVLLVRVAFLELAPAVLARALDPFPISLRTLDALHLASIEFVRGLGQEVELASYDERLLDAARRLGIPIASL